MWNKILYKLHSLIHACLQVLRGFFTGPDCEGSCKRILALWFGFLVYLSLGPKVSETKFEALLVAIAALLGIAAWQDVKFRKNKP